GRRFRLRRRLPRHPCAGRGHRRPHRRRHRTAAAPPRTGHPGRRLRVQSRAVRTGLPAVTGAGSGSYCEHMKLTADLEKKFNEQITLEFEASLVYRQLAIEADEQDLTGMASWLRHQADE